MSKQEQYPLKIIYEHAAELMRDGVSSAEIINILIEKGLRSDSAAKIVDKLAEGCLYSDIEDSLTDMEISDLAHSSKRIEKDEGKKSGYLTAVLGVCFILYGLIKTGASYSGATVRGYYTIETGIMATGVVFCIYGAVSYFKHKNRKL